MNPETAAAQQSQPASDSSWVGTFMNVMGLGDGAKRRAFASQPRSTRFSTILEAVVPSRQDPTHTKVLALVNALVDAGAVRRDEGGQIYDALLQRVSRYNSTNVQMNLDRMVRDVREAVADRTAQERAPSLGSLVALNAFLATLPATVPRGQSDFLAFVQALRLLVSEVPQVDVYQAGPDYYLQSSYGGAQTVNLTRAFKNLEPLWGVQGADAADAGRGNVSSLLTPNSRLLLLLVAPFTDAVGLDRDSYLGHLLNLYRETLVKSAPEEQTFRDITDVDRSGVLTDAERGQLRSTLNFLVSQRQQAAPAVTVLSGEEERLLRYVQQAVTLYMTQHGANAQDAIDQVSSHLEPSVYHRHRSFLDTLFAFLRRAAGANPNYFHSVILNSLWHPPPSFFTGRFEIPEGTGPLGDLEWDATFDRYRPQRPLLSDVSGWSWANSRRPSLVSSAPSSLEDANAAVLAAARGSSSSLGSLMQALDRWQAPGAAASSSAPASRPAYRAPRPVLSSTESEAAAVGRAPNLGLLDDGAANSDTDSVFGSGLRRNPFDHLRPRGPM